VKAARSFEGIASLLAPRLEEPNVEAIRRTSCSSRGGMSTIRIDVEPLAGDETCMDEALRVVLADGRKIAVPVAWFLKSRI